MSLAGIHVYLRLTWYFGEGYNSIGRVRTVDILTKKRQKELDALRRHYGISIVLAFGSYIKGRVHQESDLDIALLFDPFEKAKLGKQFFEVFSALQRIFPENKIDLVILNQADPLLLKEINENSHLLSGDYTELQKFRLYAFHRYQDYRPYLKLESEIVHRHLEVL